MVMVYPVPVHCREMVLKGTRLKGQSMGISIDVWYADMDLFLFVPHRSDHFV